MSTNNVNTNIAQIIFPPDTEIRKVRKRKKRNPQNKKKAIAELKDALQEFDLAVNTAQQNGVQLPAELSVLPKRVEDINSVKEMKALAMNLEQRTQQIQSIIQQGSQANRVQALFGEPSMPVSAASSFVAPAMSPQSGIFPPPIIQPTTPSNFTPSSPVPFSQSPESVLTPQVNRMESEVLNRMTPEEIAKAEQLEKDAAEQKQRALAQEIADKAEAARQVALEHQSQIANPVDFNEAEDLIATILANTKKGTLQPGYVTKQEAMKRLIQIRDDFQQDHYEAKKFFDNRPPDEKRYQALLRKYNQTISQLRNELSSPAVTRSKHIERPGSLSPRQSPIANRTKRKLTKLKDKKPPVPGIVM